MGMAIKEMEDFENQFIELVSEFQSVSTSVNQLREALRGEAMRAEAAEAARDAALREAAEARAIAAAATTGATQATKTLAAAQDELITFKTQFEISERQRVLLEEKCTELSNNLNLLEKEVQQLQPLQAAFSNLKCQYIELQERTQRAAEEARNESIRLEAELRRVEKCANAGSELRERARLAAAAHAHDRRLAAAERAHAAQELHHANVEIARLSIKITELQCLLSKQCEHRSVDRSVEESDSLLEVRAALEAERTGIVRLERALAAALADNAILASQLHINDNTSEENKTQPMEELQNPTTNCPIDSFLAE